MSESESLSAWDCPSCDWALISHAETNLCQAMTCILPFLPLIRRTCQDNAWHFGFQRHMFGAYVLYLQADMQQQFWCPLQNQIGL